MILKFNPKRPRSAKRAPSAARELPAAVTALGLSEKLTIAAQHYPAALPIIDSLLSRILWKQGLIDDETYAAAGGYVPYYGGR